MHGVEEHKETIWQQPLVVGNLDGDEELEGAERDLRGILALQRRLCRNCLCHSEKVH